MVDTRKAATLAAFSGVPGSQIAPACVLPGWALCAKFGWSPRRKARRSSRRKTTATERRPSSITTIKLKRWFQPGLFSSSCASARPPKYPQPGTAAISAGCWTSSAATATSSSIDETMMAIHFLSSMVGQCMPFVGVPERRFWGRRRNVVQGAQSKRPGAPFVEKHRARPIRQDRLCKWRASQVYSPLSFCSM